MEDSISLLEVIKIIKKRLFLIISIVVIAIAATVALNTYVLSPEYQAQTQILVNQKNSAEEMYSWGQMETDVQLIKTYNDIIRSPFILDKVIEELDLNLMPVNLANKITVSHQNESKVISITVEDSNPEQVVKIANTVAEVFQEEIPFLMSIDNINILTFASLSEDPQPVKPNKVLNIAIGIMMALMIGIGLTFLLEILNTTIKNEKDVEEVLQLPIMGLVGFIPIEKEKKSSFKSRKVRGNQNAWIEEKSR